MKGDSKQNKDILCVFLLVAEEANLALLRLVHILAMRAGVQTMNGLSFSEWVQKRTRAELADMLTKLEDINPGLAEKLSARIDKISPGSGNPPDSN